MKKRYHATDIPVTSSTGVYALHLSEVNLPVSYRSRSQANPADGFKCLITVFAVEELINP